MNRAVFSGIVALLAGTLQFGCSRRPIDVSADPRYHGDYVPGAVYVLTADVAALPYYDEKSRFSLMPLEYVWPESCKRIIIPRGTRLRLQSLVFEDQQYMPTMWVYFLRANARLLDGPLAGARVELRPISEQRGGAPVPDGKKSYSAFDERSLWPDPRYLKQIASE